MTKTKQNKTIDYDEKELKGVRTVLREPGLEPTRWREQLVERSWSGNVSIMSTWLPFP